MGNNGDSGGYFEQNHLDHSETLGGDLRMKAYQEMLRTKQRLKKLAATDFLGEISELQ